MELIYQLILTFLIGVVASFIGAIAGAGGLISIPFLIFLGLPPPVAVATNKFGAVGLNISAIRKFFKAKQIIWKYVLPFSLIGIFGAILGANILLNINPDLILKTVGVLIVILLPLIFLKKEFGTKRIEVSLTKKIIGYLLYSLLMVFGGFFGGGAGPIRSYILMHFFGLTIIESNATHRIPWFLLSLISLIIFMFNKIVNYQLGIALFLGMLVGGHFGAHTAIKKGNKWVKIFFAIVIIISSIKILLFS